MGRVVLQGLTHRLSILFRPIFHSIYPYTALNQLDKKLKPYLKGLDPVFLEVGANDGVRQSNTYYFQKRLGWTGILVEPIPRLAARCRKYRPGTYVVEAVLISSEDAREYVDIVDADLMSQLREVPGHGSHMELAREVQGVSTTRTLCRTMTLSSVIDESPFEKVSFMSIDVEGYELEVLSGIDFERHCPQYLLVETSRLDPVIQLLQPHMTLVDSLSHHDYLFTIAPTKFR